MFEQISSLDCQMDETNFDTEWKWNIAIEEMEKKFGTSYIASRELWIEGGQTLWKEVPQQTMVLKEQLRHGKEDKDTLTTRWKDSHLDTYNEKHKNIWWKTRMLRGMTSQHEYFRETCPSKSLLIS